MDKLHALLNERGKSFEDGELRAKVEGYGFNPDSLTDQDASTVADELAPQNGLAAASGSGKAVGKRKPAAKKPKADRLTKTPNLDNPISNLAKQVTEEVGSYIGAFQQASDAAADVESDQVIEIIEQHPNLFLEKLGEKARDYKGNPTFFRGRGEEDAGAAFGVSFATEAQ